MCAVMIYMIFSTAVIRRKICSADIVDSTLWKMRGLFLILVMLNSYSALFLPGLLTIPTSELHNLGSVW